MKYRVSGIWCFFIVLDAKYLIPDTINSKYYLWEMEENRPENLPKPGGKYEIPVEGSLGLLALGYRGILMWREKIRKTSEGKLTNKKSEDERK